MFTGIIQALGRIERISETGTNKTFWLSSPIASGFKVDQSVSHNGVCLTVEAVQGDEYQVTAILETLEKTNLGNWKTGGLVNLEQCLTFEGKLDGHIVQGHVDTTATCLQKIDRNGSWEFTFRFPVSFAGLVIEKGSISLNGISLTIFNVGKDEFSVAVIPYTFDHTNIGQVNPGDQVNIEFDMLGKYVLRQLQLK